MDKVGLKLSELRVCDVTDLPLLDGKSDEAVVITIKRYRLDTGAMRDVVTLLNAIGCLDAAERSVSDPLVLKQHSYSVSIVRSDQLNQPLITIINESNKRKRNRN
tara:strand:- start:295 stop:609 length:315 start_codon:yes stop_codon:yes gene_type:complete